MSDQTQNGGKKELSTELRLLIAFVLMGAVLFVTPYFYRWTAPPVTKKTPAPAAAARPATAAQKPAVAAAQPVPAPATTVAAQKEDRFVIDTDLYHIEFTNRGAAVRSWMLKKFRDHAGKPLELVNTATKIDPPFALTFQNQKPPIDLNQALYVAKPLEGGLGVSYEFASGPVLSRKTFRFNPKSYLSEVTTEVSENGKPIPHLIEWRGGFGDMAVSNPSGAQQSIHYDLSAGKLVKKDAKAGKDGPVLASGNYSFAGLEDTYFTAAFLPEGNTPLDTLTFSDAVPTVTEQKEQPFAGVAVGGEGINHFSLFVGPKDVDTLRAVNPKLEQLVDFGWFAIVAKPLFMGVHWVAEHITYNYGWAIVLVTIFINFVLFPLKISSMKSMKKMQGLQPQIAAINAKYKDIGIRDPRKQEQNQEVMELYKKHGVNPMGGCVPMLLQFPFLIAFYKVLSISVEMRGATWLWVTDLSQPEHLPIHILPIAMIATQFLMQKMTPASNVDPNQQRMMMMMPLIFGFMFYGQSSGLVLYWLTSNLVGIAQQWFFNRTATASEAVESVQAKKRKDGRNKR